MFATVFDGITRHSPEGLWFKAYAEQYGFPAAVEWRDRGLAIPEPGPGTDEKNGGRAIHAAAGWGAFAVVERHQGRPKDVRHRGGTKAPASQHKDLIE